MYLTTPAIADPPRLQDDEMVAGFLSLEKQLHSLLCQIALGYLDELSRALHEKVISSSFIHKGGLLEKAQPRHILPSFPLS